MKADIYMRQGYKSSTKPVHEIDKLIIVSNLDGLNEVINYPMCDLTSKSSTDIGVWKIKQLKKQATFIIKSWLKSNK